VIVHNYKIFELNIYTLGLIYKISEKYILVIAYLIGIFIGGLIVFLDIFIPEMLVDLHGLILGTLIGYLQRINLQL
jgi:hypothetical protein